MAVEVCSEKGLDLMEVEAREAQEDCICAFFEPCPRGQRPTMCIKRDVLRKRVKTLTKSSECGRWSLWREDGTVMHESREIFLARLPAWGLVCKQVGKITTRRP
jgi:hypothetical protein